MSISEAIIETGLFKLAEGQGWRIYEDRKESGDLWSLSAIKPDGSLCCIIQETRMEALQALVAKNLKEESDLTINFKRSHPDAVIPTYAKPGDAGMDVTSVAMRETGDFIEYDLGFAVAIPEGHVALLFPRSSISKYDLALCNSVGVIDSGYRGPMVARFQKLSGPTSIPKIYEVGDRVAQLVILPFPTVTYKEVEELSETERGTGGYGSTGA